MQNATVLKSEAQAIDAEVATAAAPTEPVIDPNAPPAAPVVDVVASAITEARMMIDFLVSIGKRPFPSIEKVYDEKACQDVAMKLGPLLIKYNLAGGAWAERWKEEIGFGMVAVPLLFATYDAVKSDLAARAKTEATTVAAIGRAAGAMIAEVGPGNPPKFDLNPVAESGAGSPPVAVA